MNVPLIEQVGIQAQVLVPLVQALQAELGIERANGIVRKALAGPHRCSSALLVAMSCAAWTTAAAQPPKVGYVDGDRIIHESVAAKAAEARLRLEFSRREQDLHDLTQRLQQANDRLEQDSAGLSDDDRMRRQRELIEQDRDVRRQRREFQDDLARRKEQELAALLERASQIMKTIGEREGYDFILEQGQYHSSRIDLTDKVIRELGAQGAK